MKDDETVSPQADDEIRARVRALASAVVEHADTEAALRRMPRRTRPPTARLLALAACFILAVAIAASMLPDRESVSTVTSADSATTTADGPRTLARGTVEFVEAPDPEGCCIPPDGGLPVPAGQGLGGQTMEITAVEERGVVTGLARFTMYNVLDNDGRGYEVVVELECADTGTDDVILGGTVTAASDVPQSGAFPPVGARLAVIIREGAPDRVTIWWTTNTSSCTQALESVPEPRPDDRFVDVVEGDDIETG